MRKVLISSVWMAMAAGCFGGDGNASGARYSLSSEAAEHELAALDCPIGPIGEIRVVFECDRITVYSCKDLSNVVIEFEDGERVRFEGLSGRAARFSGTGEHDGDRIVRTWVKAGANFSLDGPGYGDRFEAGDEECDPPGAGSNGGEPEPCPDGDLTCNVD